MKKLILLTLVSAFSLSLMAQDDDMYFVPTKENVAKEARKYGMPQNVYYSGSNRSVDDYNRRAQFSSPVDSTGNDIIDFSAVRGVYPDSAYSQPVENDDDYTPSEAYWDGYRAGRWSSPWYNTWYSWYDPWYYDSWWYWNDPFYYSSWYGWRYPYYYSTWYSPRYYGYHYYGGSYISRGGSSRLSSNMRFYDRRNYSSDGSRRDGTGVRAGNVRVSRPNSNNASPTINSTPRTIRSSGSFGGSSSGVSRSSGSFGGGSSRPSGGGGAVRSGGVRHR